jgi:hypothetical protein
MRKTQETDEKEQTRTWAEFWGLRYTKIISAIVKSLIIFPITLDISLQLAFGINCLIDKEYLCLWLPDLMSKIPTEFYFLVLFGIFVLSCQIIFYSWQQYEKGNFDDLLSRHPNQKTMK